MRKRKRPDPTLDPRRYPRMALRRGRLPRRLPHHVHQLYPVDLGRLYDHAKTSLQRLPLENSRPLMGPLERLKPR